MNEQFIEHWRQVAEFDYPALQAELATSEAARERAEETIGKLVRADAEINCSGDFSIAVQEILHDHFAQSEEGKG